MKIFVILADTLSQILANGENPGLLLGRRPSQFYQLQTSEI